MYIFSAHPRANGLVERYNKCIKEGLRKFTVAAGGRFAWPEYLGDVAAGLRMLPTRSGFAPYLLVFKQAHTWEAWGDHGALGVGDLADEHIEEELLNR